MKALASVNVKGGTGKTLIAINLAYYLHERGYKVGLIDCDIDNSNFAYFTRASGSIELTDDFKFKPYNWNGIQVFSMSLLARDRSISMTADRYAQMVADAINEALWDCEFYVLDLPGGADDIFRAVMRMLADKYIGSVIVSLPGLTDALKRIIRLHNYFEIPIIGVIENMSYFKCPKCGDEYYIFGKCMSEEICKEFGVNFLGRLPVIGNLASEIEKGNPIIPRDYAKPIINAIEIAIKTKPRRIGFIERLKEKFTEEMKYYIEKVIATIIIRANRELNIAELRRKYGFTETIPFILTITDESGERIITNACFKVGDTIKLVREPKNVRFQVVASAKTLARIILGKARKGDRIVDYDVWDAWYNGDIKVYGQGHTPLTIAVLQRVFGDEELRRIVREKYGHLLEKLI